MPDITIRRPAIIPAEQPAQRYFAEGRASGGIYGAPHYTNQPRARVYRHAGQNTAELSIRLGTSFEASADFTPADLRRIASDLLDAAHDIEQHPAATLAAQAAAVPA